MTCAIIFFAVYTQFKAKELESSEDTPVLFQVTWAFYAAFHPAAYVVTIIYWVTLFEGSTHEHFLFESHLMR